MKAARRVVLAIVIGGVVSLFTAAGAFASPVVEVTTHSDDFDSAPPCSLREAIQTVNTQALFGGCQTFDFVDGSDLLRGIALVPGLTPYRLTRTGTDDTNVAGDLDISGFVVFVPLPNPLGDGIDSDAATIDATGVGDRVLDVTGNTTIRGLNLVGGSAPSGGGLRVHGGPGSFAQIEGASIVNNSATGTPDAGGGGISVEPGGGIVLNYSTVSDNTATGAGGGIDLRGYAGIINASTITHNRARSDGSGLVGGGGISFVGGTGSTLPTEQGHLLLAGNSDGGATPAPECAGTFPVGGQHNLLGDVTGCTYTPGLGDHVGISDPLLGPLTDNGLFFLTRAPLPGSPAIDAGGYPGDSLPAGENASCGLGDQRLVFRKASCDIGSIETDYCREVSINRVDPDGGEQTLGTPAADGMIGRTAPVDFVAAAGDDAICASSAGDRLSGGPGRDEIRAEAGNDTVLAGTGNDVVDGGKGKDTVKAGAGKDRITVRDGKRDVVKCGPGKDTVKADAEDQLSSCENAQIARGKKGRHH